MRKLTPKVLLFSLSNSDNNKLNFIGLGTRLSFTYHPTQGVALEVFLS